MIEVPVTLQPLSKAVDQPASEKLRAALAYMAHGLTLHEAARRSGLRSSTVEKGWLRWVVLPEWRRFKGITMPPKPISISKQAAKTATADEMIARAIIAIRSEARDEVGAELARLAAEVERLQGIIRAQCVAP